MGLSTRRPWGTTGCTEPTARVTSQTPVAVSHMATWGKSYKTSGERTEPKRLRGRGHAPAVSRVWPGGTEARRPPVAECQVAPFTWKDTS